MDVDTSPPFGTKLGREQETPQSAGMVPRHDVRLPNPGKLSGMGVLRVLVVDDDIDLAVSIWEEIHKDGVEAGYCGSGKACLTKLETQAYDVLISDISMPEMSGIELVSIVRTRWPQIKVILMTAHGRQSFYDLVDRAIPILEKPLACADILAAIASATGSDDRPGV